MNLSDVKIETERLLLVPVSMRYKEEIFREFQEPVTRFVYSKPPEKIEQTEQFLKEAAEHIKKGTDLHMAVLHKEAGEFLGCVGVHDLDQENISMGVWIKFSAQGNGYGREAATALKRWADRHLEFGHIAWPVVEQNTASRKIPESLGGKIMKEYDKTMQNGRTHPMVEYWIPKAI